MKPGFGKARLVSLGLLMLASVPSAFAMVTFNLGQLVNGDIPDGSSPYATITIADNGLDSVSLTMVNNAPESNFIVRVGLSLSSNIDVSFAHVSGNVANGTTDGPDHSDGHPSMMAGLFDVVFSYPTSNADVNRFKGGENSVYTLTGTGLDETDFLALTDKGYLAAARFQGISNDGSGTVGLVPEPASIAAMAVGAMTLIRRRKQAR